jgi:AmpE protein
MAPVLSIIIVWVILRYFKQYLCPKVEWFEKYAQWFAGGLSKFIKNQQVNYFIVIFIPLFILSIIFYDLKLKHFHLLAFFVSTIILWYCCIYHQKIEILPGSLEAQEEDIFTKPLSHSFTVIFWFLISGPIGALLYDFVRRLEFYPLNKLLEWPAARILGFGYGLAGHFPPVFSYWSHHLFTDVSENHSYIKNCGYLGLYGSLEPHAVNEQSLDHAKALVKRAKMMLFIVVLIFSVGVML